MRKNTTRLREGDIVLHCGELWIVEMVNDCRARIRPEGKRKVKLERPNGEQVEFEGSKQTASISPYSDIPVVGRVEQ